MHLRNLIGFSPAKIAQERVLVTSTFERASAKMSEGLAGPDVFDYVLRTVCAAFSSETTITTIMHDLHNISIPVDTDWRICYKKLMMMAQNVRMVGRFKPDDRSLERAWKAIVDDH